jgi:predicted aspartyl protease
MLPRFALLCLGAATMITGSAFSQTPTDRFEAGTYSPPPIDSQSQTDLLAFGSDATNRMTVPVRLGGAGPYNFLVDTGSERTVISRELANRLGLQPGRTARLHSIVGAGSVNTAIIPRLSLSKRQVGSIEAPLLEASNMGADGMLGVDSLKSQKVLFDFKANTMSISPASSRAESLGDGTIVVKAQNRRGRLILTDATADAKPLTVVLDTGSQVTIGNAALRQRLLGRKMLGPAQTVTVQSVTGHTIVGDYMILKELEIGGVTMSNLAIIFADAHTFRQLGLDKKPALLLGMNAMRAFDRMSIDFANKKLRVILPKSSDSEGVQLAVRASRLTS